MKTVFLGMLCPKDRLPEIKSKNSYFDFPGNVFQQAVIDGLDKYSSVTIISAPNIKGLKGRIFKSSIFSHNNLSCDICLPIFDVPGLKEIISAWNFWLELKKFKDIDSIIIYSTSFPALYAASKFKKRNPHVKIINIITDLPEFMSTGNSYIYETLKSVGINIYSKYIDGYVLLAPKMIERLPCRNIPWIQLEGIYSNTSYKITPQSKLKGKLIMYSGALEAKYGIIDLLDAFSMLNDNEYRLYLCGSGSAIDIIKQRASNDSRIIYLGVLDHSKVIELQSEVSLLVNPRPSKDEYTIYSFPSKTIEYMASGTPVLMTRLKCLPKEYYPYLYFIETETSIGIRDKIIEIFEKPEIERNAFGHRASEFILNNKTASIQVQKIISLIKNLK